MCAQVCSGELYLPEPTYPAAFYSQEYGMGWWVGNYRGHPIAHHGGEVFGESSMVRTGEHSTRTAHKRATAHTHTHIASTMQSAIVSIYGVRERVPLHR